MSAITAKSKDIPDLEGKIFLITGGTAGLGKESILALAQKSPAKIYFTGRNEAGAESLIEQVKAKHGFDRLVFLKADISSLRSVDELSRNFLAQEPQRLHVLMCNAGIMATPPSLSAEGYEMQFATNHLGHALLIRRLLPSLLATASAHGDARIINLTSVAHNMHPKPGIDFSTLKSKQENLGSATGASFTPATWFRYGQSKLANLLYADELARRHPDVISAAVHPGVVETELVTKHLSFANRLGMRFKMMGTKRLTPEEGAKNQVWAATAKDVVGGTYYVPVGVKGNREKMGNDEGLAKELWDWTEGELDKFDGKAT